MPSKSVLDFYLTQNVDADPAMGATNTAGVNIGVRPAGAITRNRVTGKEFRQLATGGNSVLPALPRVNRYRLDEDFKQKPALNAVLDTTGASSSAALIAYTIANKDFEVLGTNMTTALVTFADGGGIKLTTAGASGDVGVITPHLDTGQTSWAAAKWNTEDEVTFEALVKTGASVASVKVYAGLKLTNTSVTATDNDQAYFLFDTGNTNSVSATTFQICTSRSNVDTFVDSGVTVAADTTYHLLIQVDQNRVPYFFINGALVGVGNGTRATGVTTSAGALTADTDLIPYVGVHALTAAAKVLIVRGVSCEKTLND